MKKKAIVLTIILLIFYTVPSCKRGKTEITPEIASSDEALYKLGETYVKKNPEKARIYMRQVIDSFPKSFYAQRAKLGIAESYFQKGDEGNLILAASEYREFISLYPLSPSAPYAQYQIGLCHFKKALGPGRDQTKTRQSLEEFRKVITTYPMSEEAEAAREKIKECEERLAEHTLGIGRLYYKMRAYKAALSRLRELLTDYPDFSKMDEVYYYLGDSYFKSKVFEESIPYFSKLITDFPESKFAEKAQKRMEDLEKAQKKE
jgi:outer membrane protein assembly factor BamD